MSDQILQAVEKNYMKDSLPSLCVGDTVDVHVRIVEGNKERIQVFGGVIIRIQGAGSTRSMTVRRIVADEGVERTFPLHSPKVAKIEVKRHGHTRRAKLYYLRQRLGKEQRLRDRRRGLAHLIEPGAEGQDQAAGQEAAAGEPATSTAAAGS